MNRRWKNCSCGHFAVHFETFDSDDITILTIEIRKEKNRNKAVITKSSVEQKQIMYTACSNIFI